MSILRAIVISFSMYSKIPMPQFKWEEEDMKYILCFFPWIGVIIGGCIYLWKLVCLKYEIGELAYNVIGVAIPLLITGGFHVDGFMDTMDAFHSYQPKERKLEILKDSHIGAFAVIMLGTYVLLYLGAFSEIRDIRLLKIVCAGFVLARCFSGIGVVTFPSAKKDGLLYMFASNAEKNIVKCSLYLQEIVCIVFILLQSFREGIVVVIAAFVLFIYYYYRCKKELGGITGDTAGYFVLICEGGMVLTTAILNIVL